MQGIHRARIALLGGLAGAALFAALPGVASAGVLVASAPSCDHADVSRPFTRWGDDNDYFLAPGGNFEGGLSGWQLNGGSKVVTDNETFHVAGAADSRSLLIPAGGSVVTPAVCVGLENPSLRFFARRSGGGLLSTVSTLQVNVIVETSLGALVEVPIGVVASGTSWQATPPYLIVANLLPLLPGNYTPVAFRLSAVGLSDWRIDDFFVDPRSRA